MTDDSVLDDTPWLTELLELYRVEPVPDAPEPQ
jgi:hypothetical protein